jgi:N utilization substance protein A
MKNDFFLAFKQILEDRGLPKEILLEAIEDAMASAYRRAMHSSSAQHIEANIDPESGEVEIYAEKEVVEDVQDDRTEVILSEARKVDPEAEPGDMVIVESTPDDFGRVAAQTARQVIQQRIREAEREVQYDYYSKQIGEIVNGLVQATSARQVTLGLDMKAEGIMPRSQQIPREYFRVHDRVRALLLDVKDTNRGPKIILSRAHPDFLRRLLENEVPEIYHGMVEIKSIAREPGQRSKVAVMGLQPGVDPVGACVGIRGVRIQAIVRELNDEKIDVIEWNPDPEEYIAKALSPARVLSVFLNEGEDGPNTATVVVPENQLSLAIGRNGQNARLTAKLTGWRIDIKSLIEATSELLFKLQNDPAYAEFAEQEEENIPLIEAIMAKKEEGRPIMPEEYQTMQNFTMRIEQGLAEKRQRIKEEREKRLKAAEAAVPEGAYDLPLLTMGFSEHINELLEEAGINSVGDLIFQMKYDSSVVEEIKGIGPKSMQEIKDAVDLMTQIAPTIEEDVEEIELTAVEEAEEAEEIEEPEEAQAAEQPEEEPEEEQPEEEVEEEELPTSMEELTKLKPEALEPSEEKQKESTEKTGKYVDVEYDPDHDVMIYRKRHKRKSEDWDKWEGELDDDLLEDL